jgi:hypothetical protein
MTRVTAPSAAPPRAELSLSADFRLICVSVVLGEQRRGAAGMRRASISSTWFGCASGVAPASPCPRVAVSLHVMEALSATATLLDFARHNNVDLIVIGAPGPEQQALAWWRSVASRRDGQF